MGWSRCWVRSGRHVQPSIRTPARSKRVAPGLAAFVERLDRSAARLEALLQRTDGSSGSVAVDRDNAELVLAGLRRWSAAFNPDKSVLKESAPELAAFAARLELSAERIAAAL